MGFFCLFLIKWVPVVTSMGTSDLTHSSFMFRLSVTSGIILEEAFCPVRGVLHFFTFNGVLACCKVRIMGIIAITLKN